MGLVDMFVTGFCFNLTCPLEPYVNDFCFEKTFNRTDGLEYINSTCPLINFSALQRRKNLELLQEELKGANLRVTTLKNGILSGYTVDSNGTVIGTGIAFDILNILQKKFEFTYDLITPKNNVFGSRNDGVFDLIKNKEAEIGVGFLPILQIRTYTNFLKYSPSLDTGEWVVLLRRPKESATGSGLLAPFTKWVWILIILSLLVVGPIIYFIIYLRYRICKDDAKLYSLSNCMWFVYGALLKQGTTLNPVADSSRLLFSTWWIFITILTAFYTANLTAFLTLSKFTLPIEQPEDIGKKHYDWITNRGNAIEDQIYHETRNDVDDYMVESEKLKNILGPQAFSEYNDQSDMDLLTEYVKQKGIMFIREKPIIDYVMYDDYKNKIKENIEEQKRCTFVITKFNVALFARGFAYSKDFKFSQLFDNAIQQLVESGIVKFKLREFLPDTEICPLNLGNKERQLRNSDLLMTYMIVGGGLIISSIVFLIEIVIEKMKQRKKPRRHHHPNLHRPPTKVLDLHSHNLDAGLKKFVTPPPAYNSLFNPPMSVNNNGYKKKNINGREYWVNTDHGHSTLIPYRTPSALLFQFTN